MHVHETIPASQGRLDVWYPRWLPGGHGPFGQMNGMVSLHFHAAGREIPWRRDEVEMFEFHLDVPGGANEVTADFDQVGEPGRSTPNFARISFFSLLLYPGGKPGDDIPYTASLRLPDGWQYGTALPVEREDGSNIAFKTASLTTLVDSPIVAGKYFSKVMLRDTAPTVEFDMAGDTAESVQMPLGEVGDFKRMLAEQLAIFGATHFRDYHFLITFSDHGGFAGLEHSESSEDGTGLNGIKDEPRLAYLLCHEFTHSWNGKYRRPAGLATPNYDAPMKGELLWVYEGLTEYNGIKLAARARLWSPEQFRDAVAAVAGYLDSEQGRTWRPVVDTARGAPGTSPSWPAAGRTSGDYYFESVLIWLEAEARIMQLTNGQKSLDDFMHVFHGPPTTGPLIRPYTFDDVVAALNKVVPYDWAGFLHERVYQVQPRAPLGGIELSGWKLGYDDKASVAPQYVRGDDAGLRYALGLTLGADGTVTELIPGMPAFNGGFSRSMKVTKVNNQPFSLDAMKGALAEERPIKFDVNDDGEDSELLVDYRGGVHIPHLVRDESKPDLLSQIIAPHSSSASSGEASHSGFSFAVDAHSRTETHAAGRTDAAAGEISAHGPFVPNQAGGPIALSIDATDCGRYLLKIHEVIPAGPGPFRLEYPKWIPGHHRPTGPIGNVTELHFTVDGNEIPWRRDDVDMYGYHLDLPQGTTQLVADFDEMSRPGDIETPKMARISVDQCILYPAETNSDDVRVKVDVTLPSHWSFGTALPVVSQDGDHVQFHEDTLTRVVDSPMVTGAYFEKIPLNGTDPVHEMDMAADDPKDFDLLKPATIQGMQNLVAEAGAMFGARHYRDYHWLITLSAHGCYIGLEHHESSEDGMGPKELGNPVNLAGLLAHEYTHSWNGKYRRPEGLATPNYQVPMKGDLLWVYEGFTQYLGKVFSARSGLWSAKDFQDSMARVAAYLDNRHGRTWRPLQDTAVAVQLTYSAGGTWVNDTRAADYYDEGVLCWLEADTIIRRLSGGRKSIDDFCKLFYGGQSGPPRVEPYRFEDVVSALNQVQPYDWRKFWRDRLDRTGEHAPLGGIENAGWKLVYNDEPSDAGGNFEYSLGLNIGADGAVHGITLGMPGYEAGFAPGMKITALNGKPYSENDLKTAIKNRDADLEFTVDQEGAVSTLHGRYTGGMRYPHLVREEGKPDLFDAIIAPKRG